MKRYREIEFEFVEFIPSKRAPRTLYISTEYATVVHDCLCGCGTKVVTPLNPTGWQLTFDGETVSLYPSIGNWGFPCRSHYIIECNRILWASDMTRGEIEYGRQRDRALRNLHFGDRAAEGADLPIEESKDSRTTSEPKLSLWRRWFGR